MRLPSNRAHAWQIMRMCHAFAQNGHHVTLYIPNRKTDVEGDSFDFYHLPHSFEIKRIPTIDLFPVAWMPRVVAYWANTLAFSFGLLMRISTLRSGIVYSRDPSSTLFLSALVPKWCYEVHDAPRKTIGNKILFTILRKIVVTNSWKKQYLMETFKTRKHKIHVEHHGVDADKFQGAKADIKPLPENKKYVIYTGHLYDWKGVYTLARAAVFFPDDIEVVMVGGNVEDVQALKTFIDREKVTGITLLGHQPHDHMPTYQSVADVLVLPTSGNYSIGKFESSPLKLFEYMSSGTPVVASDLPAVRDIVDDSHLHFVEPDRAKDLADMVIDILEKGSTKAEAAHARVALQTWERRTQRLVNFITTV